MIIRKDKSGLNAIRIPTDLDIAWAAGIYEGEGSCVKGGHGNRSFVVSVSQKDPEMLYRMRDFFGGAVKEYPNDRGTNKNGHQPFTIFAWRVCGDRARVFLAVIYSYLTARRQFQIDVTPVRIFLNLVGAVPRESGLCFVQNILAEHVHHQRRLAAERRKKYTQKFYEDRKSDPSFMKKRREQTAAWRARNKVVAIA